MKTCFAPLATTEEPGMTWSGWRASYVDRVMALSDLPARTAEQLADSSRERHDAGVDPVLAAEEEMVRWTVGREIG